MLLALDHLELFMRRLWAAQMLGAVLIPSLAEFPWQSDARSFDTAPGVEIGISAPIAAPVAAGTRLAGVHRLSFPEAEPGAAILLTRSRRHFPPTPCRRRRRHPC